MARYLMVQGTGSGVGKSVIAAGLCRWYARKGWRVAPFKAQNMSLNSGVTREGKEMGRAQILQAQAAFTEPDVRMNPILLKPQGNRHSQVIVLGQVWETLEACAYYERKDSLWKTARESLYSLGESYDLVIIEGAGSPAEINLRDKDIVNMRVALEVDAPVLLIGDIEKGGVFASLYGTWALVTPPERELIKGFLINKFRGNESLLDPGLTEIERLTGVPVLGVLPWQNLAIDDEDAFAGRPERSAGSVAGRDLLVGVIRLPHLSNYTDFQPLESEPDVAVRYLRDPAELAPCDLVILPGSKNTASDLKWLVNKGLADALSRYLADRGMVLGVCGGFQMLGRSLCDPDGLESPDSWVRGLGLLDMETTFFRQKCLRRVEGVSPLFPQARMTGYEIHQGQTRLISEYQPFFQLDRMMDQSVARPEGVVVDGRIFGTYLHGLFDSGAFRRAFLNLLRASKNLPPLKEAGISRLEETSQELDRLADLLERCLDQARLRDMTGIA